MLGAVVKVEFGQFIFALVLFDNGIELLRDTNKLAFKSVKLDKLRLNIAFTCPGVPTFYELVLKFSL